MILHHLTALTTAHKIYNITNNENIKKLTQEKEITQMKVLL